jgi:hypothetical protein
MHQQSYNLLVTTLVYSSPFTIPACNRDYQKSATDLYLGLRIAYNVKIIKYIDI